MPNRIMYANARGTPAKLDVMFNTVKNAFLILLPFPTWWTAIPPKNAMMIPMMDDVKDIRILLIMALWYSALVKISL